MKKVLVKEDQMYIREFISDALRRGGYEPVEELSEDIVAAVLDSRLTGTDSFELCQTIRDKNEKTVILMLTETGENLDRLTGYMTGADDQMTKPFSTAELLGRLEVLLSRVRQESVRLEELVSCGPFILDTRNATLEKFGEPVRLTRAEYSLLKLLMQNPQRELSKEELLQIVWGDEADTKQLDLCIRCLRIKLEDDPNQPEYIATVWGHGYKWCG